MNSPTAARMAQMYTGMLWDEDVELGEAAFELNRSLESPWPEDLPRAARELLRVLESFRGNVRSLLNSVEEVFPEEETAQGQKLQESPQ